MSKLSENTGISAFSKLSIFGAALAVRLAFIFLSSAPLAGTDSKLYLEIAGNILSGNGFATDAQATAFVSPGLPIFLAFCLRIFGENPLWANILSAFLSSSGCVFIAETASNLFGKRAGIIAGFISAFYYELILWGSVTILTEPLYIFFLAAACRFLVKGFGREIKRVLPAVVSGIFFGLAGLTRPTAFPITVGISVLLVFFCFLRDKSRVAFPVILLAACFLTMLPWGVRNYLTLGHFTILSLEGGHVFWLGNNSEYDKFEHPDFERFGGYTTMFNSFPPEVRGKSETEANRLFYAAAWKHIFEHPVNFIVRGFHKTYNMWRPAFSGSSTKNLLVSSTLYPLLLFFSLAGMYLSLAKTPLSQPKQIIVYAFVWAFVLHLVMHFTITGEIRFRVPLWVFLIPFAALSADFVLKLFCETKASARSNSAVQL